MEFNRETKLHQIDRIEKLNNQKKYLRVFRILNKHNKYLKYTCNNNGAFIRYDNLNVGTYKEIHKFLDNCDKHRIKIELPTKHNEYLKPFHDLDSKYSSGKLKFTAKERNILKAKKILID